MSQEVALVGQIVIVLVACVAQQPRTQCSQSALGPLKSTKLPIHPYALLGSSLVIVWQGRCQGKLSWTVEQLW